MPGTGGTVVAMAYSSGHIAHCRQLLPVVSLCIALLAVGCSPTSGTKEVSGVDSTSVFRIAQERLYGNEDSALANVGRLETFAAAEHDARLVLKARAMKAEVLLHNRAPGFAAYMEELEGFDVAGAPLAYAPWATYYRALWQLGDRKWDASDSLLNSLFHGEKGPPDPELYLRCRIAQLKVLASRKEQAQADSLANLIRPALEVRGDPELLWRFKAAHALAHLNGADPQGAELLYGEALVSAQQAGGAYAEGITLHGSALAQMDQGLSDQCAKTANLADEALVRAGDQRDRVDVLKLIGYCYWDILGPEEVVKRWNLAMRIADSLDMPREKAMLSMYAAKFRVSLDSSESRTLGYDHTTRFDTAMRMVKDAEHTVQVLQDMELVAYGAKSRAAILNWEGRFDESYTAVAQVHQYFTELGDQKWATSSLIDMASNEIAREHWNAAINILKEALPLAENGHYASLRLLALNRLSFAYRNLGQYEKALEYKDSWTTLKDSLEGVEVTARLAQTELRHSFAKRQYADSLAHAQALNMERKSSEESVGRVRRRSIGLAGGGLLLSVGGYAAFALDRKRRRERYAKQAAQLEIKALRAQMNPHFIFNALNSISAFIRQQEPEKAHGFIARFSKLMRIVLENSRRNEVPLSSDIEGLGIYMELEQARSGNAFDTSITVDPAIDQAETMVPPLVLQPFVENAVWHGMAGKVGHGKVEINIKMRNGALVVTISDDGLGMPKDKPAGTGRKSLGTVITKERLDQLAEQKGRPAGFRYLEWPKGTCVEVVIPV
jgi:two-component sensor histidine kinase